MVDVLPGDKGGTISFSLACKCIAEFVGTALFVFAGTAAISHGNIVVPALAHGLAIFVLITSLGHISGGHFNPAITLGVFLAGRIRPVVAASFVIVQLCGGVVGAILTRGILNAEDYTANYGGSPFLHGGYAWPNGLLAEILTSFFLVQSVLQTAVDEHKLMAGLAIGLTISIDIFIAGPITGAAMNPARAFGPSIVWQLLDSNTHLAGFWEHHYIYWLGPAIGAALAAALYRACYSRESRLLQ